MKGAFFVALFVVVACLCSMADAGWVFVPDSPAVVAAPVAATPIIAAPVVTLSTGEQAMLGTALVRRRVGWRWLGPKPVSVAVPVR